MEEKTGLIPEKEFGSSQGQLSIDQEDLPISIGKMSKGNGNGAATDLVLYYYPYSFYSQKVVMALHQMKIKFKPKVVDIHKGRQFAASFLALNPKGEVPVLVDDVRVIPESEQIIEYIQDNFANGNPGLLPKDREIRGRVEQFHAAVHGLEIEALGFGAAMYDDLGINPKPPYNCLTNRNQMKDYLSKRPRILQNEIIKNPGYADMLNRKLVEIEEESRLWQDRQNYEELLIRFEKVLDECEAELSSHEDVGWWLCSSEVSLADVDLSLLLYRLWQLGFERRMWERNRPQLMRYFSRVQHLDSFNRAITLKEGTPLSDLLSSPVFLGVLGTTVILAGGYYLWTKKGDEIGSALQTIFNEDNRHEVASRTQQNTTDYSSSSRPSGRYGRQFM